jgi:prophage tail gpP-like protein
MTDILDTPTRPGNAIDSKEQATLIVGGVDFRDWESVFVQMRWLDPFHYFKFTSVERDAPTNFSLPTAQSWFLSPQFMPGTPCQIMLGGVPVIKGYLEIRQVAYDANRHGIELQGKSWTAPAARSSVNTSTGSFDGMTFKQVADKVAGTYGIKVIPVGSLNSIPFDKLQNQPGEPVWDFLERIARPRGIMMGSDGWGNFLAIGDHNMPILNTQLIEGQNIKTCQCVFHKDIAFTEYKVTAQSAASDDNAYTKASELEASWGGSGFAGSMLHTPSEQPVKNQQEVIDRAKNEALWHEGPTVELTVTVQGWFRDDINLWMPGDNVFVYSPMCPLNQLMKIKQVTFTQDNNSGTMTQLDLLQPWALKDGAEANISPSENSTATKPPETVAPGEKIVPTP